LAPIAREFAERGIRHTVIHTGQHYDEAMNEALFADFTLEAPAYNLGIGSGSHAVQTARMMTMLEPLLLELKPDWVLTYGDTNSTLAAALTAVKIRMRVAHLEAGLRWFNREMPEELNRVLTDHASDLLLVPTQTGLDNLAAEGLASSAVLVGDVMADICLSVARQVASHPPEALTVPSGDFAVVTIHRPYNTDDPARLRALLSAFAASPIPVLLPAHPRLVAKAAEAGVALGQGQ
jgi:UDP-N-acetylglucosamine 2-epimerase (non-hydrolysing)